MWHVERGILCGEVKVGGPSAPSPIVQVFKTGNFKHPQYGDFSITAEMLQDFIRNFAERVRGTDIPVDYFHKSDQEAAGWFTELFLSEDEQELWGKVDWTKAATLMLSDREVRYFSPDFALEWTHPETGVTYKNVLFGGGLTNRPFLKDMAAIVAAEKGDQMKLEDLEKKVMKLAEDGDALKAQHAALQTAHADLQTKHAALQKKTDEMSADDGEPAPAKPTASASAGDGADSDDDGDDDSEDLKKQLADMTAKCAQYEEKLKASEAAKQMAEKESAFNVLLSEGKACVAQKEAFIKGDTETFAKLAEPLNLNGRGSSGGGQGNSDDELADRVLKLAEQKVKADSKLKMVDAITMAKREIK